MSGPGTLVLLALLFLPIAQTSADEPQPSGQKDVGIPQAKTSLRSQSDQAPGTRSDELAKAKVLRSERWQTAMQGLNAWLRAQPIYDPRQVERIHENIDHRVAMTSAPGVERLLLDLEIKLKLIGSEQGQQALASLTRFYDAASESKRAELAKEFPNPLTMTPAQVAQQVRRINARQQSLVRAQAQFDLARTEQVNQSLVTQKTAQQVHDREQLQSAANLQSLVRAPNIPSAHESLELGADLGYFLTPLGGFVFTPSGAFR